MRVGIVSEYYDPEGGSAVVPGFIARALVARGMQVDVLTGYPNYPRGRVFDGYRQRPHAIEHMQGVRVHRVPLNPNHSDKAAARIAAYASFAAASSLAMGCLRHCDVVLVYSTPVSVGLGPALQRMVSRRPVVTLVEDMWPETLTHSGMAGKGVAWRAVERVAALFSDWVYDRSDAVAVIAPSMVDALEARGVPKSKLQILYNWVPDELVPALGASHDNEDFQRTVTRFIYAGNLGEPQGVRSIVQAAVNLRDRNDIHFTLVGSGVLAGAIRERVSREGLRNVDLLDARPVSEVRDLVAKADVQLVTLAPSPLFEMTIPSKVQFSLAFGKPIVAAVAGDPARVAIDSGAAIVCAPGDVQALTDAIRQAADLPQQDLTAMGRRGSEYFRDHFSESVAAAALADLLTSVVKSVRP